MPTTEDIQISVTPKGTRRTYSCDGVHTATVYLMAGRWWVRCYYGPDEHERRECATPYEGDQLAIRHTLRLIS